jgi:hypothetical protein
MFKIKILNHSKLFQKILFNNLSKFFTTVPVTPAGNSSQVSTAVPKTKEELKIEALMSQWPEYIRNPPKGMIELERIKKRLEDYYKFYQSDKKYVGEYTFPAEIKNMTEKLRLTPRTTDSVVDVFQKYDGFLADNWIVDRFHLICTTHKDLTPDFFEVIVPKVKQLIIKADRQCPHILALAYVGAATVKLGDTEFWDMLVIITT